MTNGKEKLLDEIFVKHYSAKQFSAMESEWSKLLDRSDANRVFMSWCWLHTWWEVFGPAGPSELRLIVAFDSRDRMIGIAPLFVERSGSLLKSSRRLQLLGGRWRAEQNIRTEYLDFILDRTVAERVAIKILEHIHESNDWDEFVICNVASSSVLRSRVGEWADHHRYYVRDLEPGSTYQLSLDGDFPQYLATLSPKSRLKIFNQRKRLESHGKVEVTYPTDTKDIHTALEVLDSFHQSRWNKTLLDGLRKQFHDQVAPRLAQRSMLDLSVLTVAGEPVSVLYDLCHAEEKYGFQLGFNQFFDKRLSPSQLHFGYAIESAFERGLTTFDFLRGAGKSRVSYKGRIASTQMATSTVQIVRNNRLKRLHSLQTWLRRTLGRARMQKKIAGR